jgi:hypothetical protein
MGRRRTIGMCVGLFSLDTAATGFTWDALSFGATRQDLVPETPSSGIAMA